MTTPRPGDDDPTELTPSAQSEQAKLVTGGNKL